MGFVYTCGCWSDLYDHEPCCPVHLAPIAVGTATSQDIEWALDQLRRNGLATEED